MAAVLPVTPVGPIVMLEVLALKVRPVIFEVSQGETLSFKVMALAPSVIVRVLEFAELRLPHEQVWPLVLRVPVVRVTAPTTVEPTVCVRVRSLLLIVMELALAAAVIVTVAAAPLLASKVTSSAEVGTAAPPAPPEDVDQFVVVTASQLPVPPTQNLAAIYATATHRHLLVAVFQKKPTSSRAFATVVVGRATVLDSNEAPQVIALPVPSSVILIRNVSPPTGVPVKLVVKDVIAAD